MQKSKTTLYFSILICILIILFLMNIALGQVSIPIIDVLKSILGKSNVNQTFSYIIINFRLPKAITAIFVGVGLSVCGLFMQTLFRNPMAGPYVLGLSSGSSLGVALLILGSQFFTTSFLSSWLASIGIMIASSLGSFFVLLLVLLVSKKMTDTMMILIIGLMFSSFAGAVVNVLIYFSSAEQLQKFTFWTMGNIGNLSWNQVLLLGAIIVISMLASLPTLKWLDAFLLGENYAKSLGINIKKSRTLIIIITSILSGSITAFAGPIAFVGLAVPHIAKLLFQTSSHKILFFATLLIGAITLLFCDTISQMPGFSFTIPINAITSIIGAPVVVWLILGKKNRV